MDFKPRSRRNGFTLVEMLTVIALIAFMMGVAMISIEQVIGSTRLDHAGRLVVDEILRARQSAATRNTNVELRFIKTPSEDPSFSPPYFWRVQAGVYSPEDATAFRPIDAPAKLPVGVRITASETLSPLLNRVALKTSTTPAYDYVPLTVRPSGEIDVTPGLPHSERKAWCLTLVPEKRAAAESADEVSDFITIQIDPMTSRPRFYRP